jgi:hypothetical protein
MGPFGSYNYLLFMEQFVAVTLHVKSQFCYITQLEIIEEFKEDLEEFFAIVTM